MTATTGQHATSNVVELDPSDHVDGRTLRRTRNRTAVIAALLQLMREGTLEPAATDIADRAGVSHRSIFRYFDDLDDLVRTSIDQAIADAGPAARVADYGKGSFDERIAAFVDARLRLYVHVDGPMRVARMRAYSIPSLDVEFSRLFALAADQIRTQFADELAEVEPPADDHLVDAVLTLVSHDAYSVHVRLLGHDPQRIRAAWITALTTLLTPH